MPPPPAQETREFWSKIWSTPEHHNQGASWIQNVKEKYTNVEQGDRFVISLEEMKNALGNMAPWKAPGPDGVQAYWVKQFTSLHERMVDQMQECVEASEIPSWITRGRTVLIPKDLTKGNVPSNYRPITCLPIIWKLLTSVIANNIHQHLNHNGLIPWEQKGCAIGSRGTKDHLLLDKAIMRDSRNQHTNLTMAWVDYRKAYDMVPH